MSWFVIRTKSRQERRAGEHLDNQNFEYYCPWMKRDNGKEEPLFPGYIFVYDVASQQSLATIRSTRGILGFVRFGLEFAKASDELIVTIQERESGLQSVDRFKADDSVRFKNGPFADIEAIYRCKSGIERSIVLLNILNQPKEISVRTDDLRLA